MDRAGKVKTYHAAMLKLNSQHDRYRQRILKRRLILRHAPDDDDTLRGPNEHNRPHLLLLVCGEVVHKAFSTLEEHSQLLGEDRPRRETVRGLQ